MYFYIESLKINKRILYREDINNLTETFQTRIDNIENTEEFDKNVTKLCLWCDYLKEGHCELSDKELMKIL